MEQTGCPQQQKLGEGSIMLMISAWQREVPFHYAVFDHQPLS